MISKRYESDSIILTSHKTSSEWGQIFGDEVLAAAINGPSYRLKNRLKAIERENNLA